MFLFFVIKNLDLGTDQVQQKACLYSINNIKRLTISSFPRLKVERKRKLLKAKLTRLKEEGGGGAGAGVTGGGDSAGTSLLEDPASLAEFKKHKKTKEFRSEGNAILIQRRCESGTFW